MAKGPDSTVTLAGIPLGIPGQVVAPAPTDRSRLRGVPVGHLCPQFVTTSLPVRPDCRAEWTRVGRGGGGDSPVSPGSDLCMHCGGSGGQSLRQEDTLGVSLQALVLTGAQPAPLSRLFAVSRTPQATKLLRPSLL